MKNYPCVDKGKGRTILLLHGLFGDTSNWKVSIDYFSSNFRVLVPKLPVYRGPKKYLGITGLLKYTEEFIEAYELDHIILMGNSLGGHVALMYALHHPDQVHSMILTGSSGLYENTAGTSIVRRGNYAYIKERVGYSFYDPDVVDDSFSRRIFDLSQDNSILFRVISYARAAKRHNLSEELHKIQTPTLLIWGLNDPITPPYVGHDFLYRLPQARLAFIDKCCHAPMMEQPHYFNQLVSEFTKEKVLSE